jgi:hypothetical protein
MLKLKIIQAKDNVTLEYGIPIVLFKVIDGNTSIISLVTFKFTLIGLSI